MQRRRIVIASKNSNKIKEISYMLSDVNMELIPQSYYTHQSIKENRLSFVENAILKARFASKISGLPALADDSGLIIPSILNEPGIFSARYSKEKISNTDKLLSFLSEKNINYLYGFYYCVVCLVFYENDPLPIISSGKLAGTIINKKKGSYGFGYDSCFYLKKYGMTISEIDPLKKNQISHRSKAIYKLKRNHNFLISLQNLSSFSFSK